jgi:hypothetical protein
MSVERLTRLITVEDVADVIKRWGPLRVGEWAR